MASYFALLTKHAVAKGNALVAWSFKYVTVTMVLEDQLAIFAILLCMVRIVKVNVHGPKLATVQGGAQKKVNASAMVNFLAFYARNVPLVFLRQIAA